MEPIHGTRVAPSVKQTARITAPPGKTFARIHAWIRRIPRGEVRTYGEIAHEAQVSVRTVVWALRNCPREVPWHRILGKRGVILLARRFPLLAAEQAHRLSEEGWTIRDGKVFRTEKFLKFCQDECGIRKQKGRVRHGLGIVIVILCVGSLLAQSDLALPHMAVGGNPAFETLLQISNEVETNNTIIIEAFQGSSPGSTNGAPFSVSFDGRPLSASRTLTLSPFQELTTILTIPDVTFRNGWVRVRSTTAGGKVSGNLLFRQKSAGTVISSVGVTTPQRFRHAIIQLNNQEEGSNTGIAFVNPDNTALTVTIDLFQGANNIGVFPPVTLQPNQHFAKLVSEMFPALGRQQGTLVIETAPGRSIPYLTLRLDGSQLTAIPVRPLGFTFQYEVRNSANAVVEAGFWMFDFVGFDLIGVGRRETGPNADPPGAFFSVSGSWLGTNFQFRYRVVFPDGTIGIVVFNGTSAGPESTIDVNQKSRVVSGTVTTMGADGQVKSVNNFTAFHKFGSPPAM